MDKEGKLYVGTYAKAEQPGIHVFSLKCDDTGVSEIKEEMTGSGVSNPSYLTVSTDSHFLYTVLEDATFQDKPGGGVAAFKIENNALELLNTCGTDGIAPCYVLLDEERGYLYAANYTSGSVCMFRVEKDGRIGGLCDFHQHTGTGPNPDRQEGPHVHFTGFTADKKGIWVVDLGLDRIKYYRIDEVNAKLVPDDSRDIVFPGGVGPRHFVLDQSNREIMYVVSEMSSEIFVVACKQEKSDILQRISTLPDGVENSACAAIHLSEDGRFLYASNRGDDSIAVFAIDADYKLTLVQIAKVNGKNPRDFCLYQGMLFSANQHSDKITIFQVDKESGKLTDTGRVLPCKSPVCLVAV